MSKTEETNKNESSSPLLTGFIIQVVVRLIFHVFNLNISEWWLLPVSAVFMFWLWWRLQSYFTNTGPLLMLLYVLITVIPVAHFELYKNDVYAYAYDDNYLTYVGRGYSLQDYRIDSLLRAEIDTSLGRIYQTPMHKLVGQKIPFYEYQITFVNRNSHPGRRGVKNWVGWVEATIQDSSQVYNRRIIVNNPQTVAEVLEKFKSKGDQLLATKMSPQYSLTISDFWIESFLAFVVGNIKPVSYLARMLMIVQLLIGAIIAVSFSNVLEFIVIKKRIDGVT